MIYKISKITPLEKNMGMSVLELHQYPDIWRSMIVMGAVRGWFGEKYEGYVSECQWMFGEIYFIDKFKYPIPDGYKS